MHKSNINGVTKWLLGHANVLHCTIFLLQKNIQVSRVKSNIIRWYTKSSNVSLNTFLVSSSR